MTPASRCPASGRAERGGSCPRPVRRSRPAPWPRSRSCPRPRGRSSSPRSARARSTSRTGTSRRAAWTTSRRRTVLPPCATTGRCRWRSSSTSRWPLVFAALGRRRRTLVAALAILAAASCAYSIAFTAARPGPRVLRHADPRLGARRRRAPGLLPAARSATAGAVASWLGLAAISVAAWSYDASTPFPGLGGRVAGGRRARRHLGRHAHFVPALGHVAAAGRHLLSGLPVALATARVRAVRDRAPGGHPHDPRGAHAHSPRGLVDQAAHRRPASAPRRASTLDVACAGAATLAVLGVATSGSVRLQHDLHASEVATQRLLASQPDCFAAAARDPERPCENPKLRRSVVPSPIEARKQRNSPCPPLERRGLLYVCGFGVDPARASTTVALIGDSHAAHWRAAIDASPASAAGRASRSRTPTARCRRPPRTCPSRAGSQCVEWNRQVLRWLARHREVTTVFLGQISGGAGVIAPGRDQLAAQRDGYVACVAGAPALRSRAPSSCGTRRRCGATRTPACSASWTAAGGRICSAVCRAGPR